MPTTNTASANRQNMFYWQVDRPFSLEEIKRVFIDRADNFDENIVKEAIAYSLQQIADKRKILKLHTRHTAGSVNLVYRATLDDNSEVIIRIHPSEAKNGYFWVEKVAADKSREAGVRTYQTLYIDATRKKFGFDFMLMTALPGVNMQEVSPLAPEVEKSILEDLGRQLALIHSVKTEKYGFFDNNFAKEKVVLQGIHKNWQEHFFAALDANLMYLVESHALTDKEKEKVEKIFADNKMLIACESPVLVHNDIADHNTLIDRDSGKVTGILDWDECFSGDPVMDFAAWSVFYPFERMEHMKKGYQTIASLPDSFAEKLHLYRVRYIISKATVRSKKLAFVESAFNRGLLEYALKILQDEFVWFGTN